MHTGKPTMTSPAHSPAHSPDQPADQPQPLRRRLLAALGAPALLALPGCAAPWPAVFEPVDAGGQAAAAALLAASAQAHGISALRQLQDLSISYVGEWRALINRLQPALVDERFRQGSQERLLLREGLVAQAHRGTGGAKQVVRRSRAGAPGDVRVWFNGEEALGTEPLAAAALVVDGYSLFLLGPMWLADRAVPVALGGTETVEGHECDIAYLRLAPGLGLAGSDRIALFIDREDKLMRRVRFTLDGLGSTVGAVAEVETFDFITLHGVRWPTRFFERIVKPFRLAVHDWHLTGLDVNRGMTANPLSGPSFTGAAVAPAAALAALPVRSSRR